MQPPGQPPIQTQPADLECPEKLDLPRSPGWVPTSPGPGRRRSARSWPGWTLAPGPRVADRDSNAASQLLKRAQDADAVLADITPR